MSKLISIIISLSLVLLTIPSALCASKTSLHILNEDNWEQVLKGEWMIEFYAPWCPACKALDPIWQEFASWSQDLGIKVGQIDVTESPGLSGRFMITALPTIYHVKNAEFRQYRGSRDRDEFLSFIEEEKWKMVEPVSSWRSPASLQMSAVSGVFKLSMLLRNLHTQLTDDYGIPYWVSYILFGIATIVFGTLLALAFVFVIDCLCPPRSSVKTSNQDVNSEQEKWQEEFDDEELLDERSSPVSSATQSEAESEEEKSEENKKPETKDEEENVTVESEPNEQENENDEDIQTKPVSPVRQRRPRRAE